MMFIKSILAAGIFLPTVSFAASITTITFGDNDCFGRNEAVCGPGTQITSPTAGFDANGILPFPTQDLSSPIDHAGTDVFGENGPLTFSFIFDPLGMTVTDLTVTAKVWGLDLAATSPANGGTFGDAFEGARFQLNGVDIGTYFAPPGPGPDLIEIPSFAANPALLRNGLNAVSILPETDFIPFSNAFFTGLDAFAVDFVSVAMTLEDVPQPPAVPLPAGLPLLLGGLALFGLAGSRRR